MATEIETLENYCRYNGAGWASAATAKAALAKLEADAQALADVRTLDEWARERGTWWETFAKGDSTWSVELHAHANYSATDREFTAPTPDAARAKAAAWVREQKR